MWVNAIAYAIRNSTKTAGNELTDLVLIEDPLFARRTLRAVELRPSARASAPACVPVEVWERRFS